ncbi:hypothetical protein BJX62DRAFT_220167 [Aspergillus germanicus]
MSIAIPAVATCTMACKLGGSVQIQNAQFELMRDLATSSALIHQGVHDRFSCLVMITLRYDYARNNKLETCVT